jgi:hypothetical protein
LTDFASSKDWGGSILFLYGILSYDEGGYFNNWPKVIIKNCDGGSYLGNREPITYKNKKIYFRGSQNILEAVRYLNSIKFLRDRQEIVMVGSFNAGIGMLMWADYFKSQTLGSFRVIADAVLFLNEYNHRHKRYSIENRMKQIEKIVFGNATIPNKKCAAAHVNEEWKCLFINELINFVDHPVYFLQSLYDGWDISEILGFYCTQ